MATVRVFWLNNSRRATRYLSNAIAATKKGLVFANKNSGGITAVATIALAVLTYFYVSYSHKQWDEMRNSQRPWVGLSERLTLQKPPSFDVIEVPPNTGLSERSIQYRFIISGTLRNFGNSPARKVYDSFEIIPQGQGAKFFRDAQCIVAVAQSKQVPPFPGTMNEEIEKRIWSQPTTAIFPSVEVPIKANDLESVIFMNGGVRSFPNPIWIVGCVAYQDSAGEIHHTKVLYRSITAGAREIAILNPELEYEPITEFVMEDSDAD